MTANLVPVERSSLPFHKSCGMELNPYDIVASTCTPECLGM